MKKILLVSGCSFTDPDWWSEYHPEMDTSWPKWPELLAKKLNMDYVNLGSSGAGNEYIYSSLLDYITNPQKDVNRIGLVIPAWTQCQRRDYQRGLNGRWLSRRLDVDGDIFGWVNKSLKYMLSLQLVCERYNLSYKQFQMLNLYNDFMDGLTVSDREIKSGKYPKGHKLEYPGYNNDEKKVVNIITNYEDRLDTKHFIGWPFMNNFGGYSFVHKYLSNHYVSELDSHPNKEGQELIAEKLYDRLG